MPKLVHLAALLALTALATGRSLAVCPEAGLIRPCTCDDEGLQCLRLNDSGLARVFSAPAERKAIRRVWIFQTNLTTLGRKAFGDYIIRDLYLDLNQISSVHPETFGEATKTLQSLSLTRNLLGAFPFDVLRHMSRLKQLGLGHNQLTTIGSGLFPPSDSLESVDLSHNSIDRIEPYAFSELYEVSLIDLSRNRLRGLDSRGLMVKSSSRHLAISLRGNQIHKLAVDAFGEHHPHAIDLSRNNLTYLDELAFAPLILNGTVIDVDANPFNCVGCELYKWLLELDPEYQSNILNFACTDDTKLEDLTLDTIGCQPDDDQQSNSSI